MADGIRRKPIPYITPTIAAARRAQFPPFILSSVVITRTFSLPTAENA